MCKAHVLRFSCGHGLIMNVEACDLYPCPMIKTTGLKLPQQPFKCYNCQFKRSSSDLSRTSTRNSTCTSSVESLDSNLSSESSASSETATPASPKQRPTHPLPGVARQPATAVSYCATPFSLSRTSTGLPPSKSSKAGTSAPNLRRISTSNACTFRTLKTSTTNSNQPFRFSCTSSSHPLTPHYSLLPSYLPHQDHPCPPCQIECLRRTSLSSAATSASKRFPHLTSDMLIVHGKPQPSDCPFMKTLCCETYVAECVDEEKQCWWGVGRKWVQDLKKCRVLVAEEDGLGLMG